MIAIIGGTSLLKSSLFNDLERELIESKYGQVTAYKHPRFIFVQRHGINGDTPPHAINYKANIAAIRDSNVSDIISINSTGSLKKEILPGSLLVPDDYFNLFNIPTFFETELKFTVPGLDKGLREFIVEIARQRKLDVITKGVYFQVQGPILETPAEIRFASQIGDVVGMTMAKEAILAKELDLKYASICMVDNYANGIIDEPLSIKEIIRKQDENLATVEAFLQAIIEGIG